MSKHTKPKCVSTVLSWRDYLIKGIKIQPPGAENAHTYVHASHFFPMLVQKYPALNIYKAVVLGGSTPSNGTIHLKAFKSPRVR